MSGYSPDQVPIPDPGEGWEEELAEQDRLAAESETEEADKARVISEQEAEAAFEAWLDSLPDIEF